MTSAQTMLEDCARIAEEFCEQGRDGYQIAKAIRAIKRDAVAVAATSPERIAELQYEAGMYRSLYEAQRSFDSTGEPIATAPKDGTHILAWRIPIGIRVTNNTHPPTVVHWFDDPDQPGFYTSVNERAPEHPFDATHWTPLPASPLMDILNR